MKLTKDIHATGIGKIPIADIIIGERFREDQGDIDSMMFSIDTYGQLEPIIVMDNGNGQYKLICGCTRILAFKKLDKTEIDARLFETLDEVTQAEIELELDVRRKGLNWAELAKATARIAELKKVQYQMNTPSRFGRGMSQKQIATELNMSESTLSENLAIATGLEQHPALEFNVESRKQALKIIRDKSFEILDGGQTNRFIDESYVVASATDMLAQIPAETADLVILDPPAVSSKLLRESFLKLKAGGSIIVFTNLIELPTWISHANSLDLYTVPPSIWHIKSIDLYVPFVWFGKHRERPLRLLPPHISCPKSKAALHPKAKPYNLMQKLIKSCTEMGAFVVLPECYDIETVKCCLDCNRNIRAACSEKMLRDKLVINAT